MTFTHGLRIILLASTFFFEVSVATEHCVKYGVCGENDFGLDGICIYNGTALPLNDEAAQEILREICPELSEEPNLCCTLEQLEALQKSLKMIETLGLGRCPSCNVNFRKNFCQFVCSPKQNKFIEVTKIGESDEGDEIVASVNYYMSNKYADGMFASCKDVQALTPGATVLDIMCGTWGRKCNPERWLNFMGATPDEDGFSPFQIKYVLTDDETVTAQNRGTFHPMNESTTSCSQSPGPNLRTCTCADCEAACLPSTDLPLPLPTEQETRTTDVESQGHVSQSPDHSLRYSSEHELSNGGRMLRNTVIPFFLFFLRTGIADILTILNIMLSIIY